MLRLGNLSPWADINTFIKAHNSFVFRVCTQKYLTKVLPKHPLEESNL